MTQQHRLAKQIVAAIAEGRGQGHGNHYRPWLRVTRRNSSPKSNQVVGRLPGYSRQANFFALSEWSIAVALVWLGVVDVREQFPLWPMEHMHPLAGAQGAEKLQLRQCRGLLEIARDAGIPHGVLPGTNIPYIATIDLMVTVNTISGSSPALVALSAKPVRTPRDINPASRVVERLELERRYCNEAGISYRIVHPEVLNRTLANHLAFLSYAATLPPNFTCPNRLEEFASLVEERAEGHGLWRATTEAAKKHDIEQSNIALLLHHCVWRGLIDVDLSKPLLMSYPPERGATQLRKRLRRELLGEAFV